MVEMAGKEYLLKLRKERTPMREEIVRLLAENGTLSFQEIYLEMEGQYHKYCPFPYERDRILEGVVKNELPCRKGQQAERRPCRLEKERILYG